MDSLVSIKRYEIRFFFLLQICCLPHGRTPHRTILPAASMSRTPRAARSPLPLCSWMATTTRSEPAAALEVTAVRVEADACAPLHRKSLITSWTMWKSS